MDTTVSTAMSGVSEEALQGTSLFRDINTDDAESQPTEIESMCMNCHDNCVTRLMLTMIPFFKEVIISSFRCDHCHWSNTEIQSVVHIQDQGIRYTVRIRSKDDLNRQVVRSDSAFTKNLELNFEVPAFTQKGSLTTVPGPGHGRTRAGPADEESGIPRRGPPDEFINNLQKLKDVEEGFTLVIEDISGNSFMENPVAPQRDEAMTLGLAPENQPDEEPLANTVDGMRDEVLQFYTNCPECNVPASTNMKLVQIPHFNEVIIMATNCEKFGHRTNEVKSGGATGPMGTRITLHVTDASDMCRDLLKSVCELGMAVLGGKFTTLEGLLTNIKELFSKNHFTCGVSPTDQKKKMDVHFVLDDPDSYMPNVYAPDPDPEMTIENTGARRSRTRTWASAT
ncbi:LOW QUALITY PROTEIN: hypothetical protein CRUP_003146 [Coryphaenoides rupestris]|nr:LOW QUALITY PROTEIN: hypothetical protein CRUP_003146 [Coryphaenoides rupestris]